MSVVYVQCFILSFMCIIWMLGFLLLCYYMTPSLYEIKNYVEKDFILIETLYHNNEISNKTNWIRFVDDVTIVVNNNYKSIELCLTKNNIIKLFPNSVISIKNKSNVSYQLYSYIY